MKKPSLLSKQKLLIGVSALFITLLFSVNPYAVKLIVTTNIPDLRLYYNRGDRTLKLHYAPEKIRPSQEGFFEVSYTLPAEYIEKLFIKPDLTTYEGTFQVKQITFTGHAPLYEFSDETLHKLLTPINHITNIKLKNHTLFVSISGAFPLVGIDFLQEIQHHTIAETIDGYRADVLPRLVSLNIGFFLIVFLLFLYLFKIFPYINRKLVPVSQALFSSNRRAFLLLLTCVCLINIYIFYPFITFKKCLLYYDLASDSAFQIWPYLHHLMTRLRENTGLFWSFHLGIGTAASAFEHPFGLYNPLHLLFFLVRSENIPYVFIFVLILKILIAGLGCFVFLNKLNIAPFTTVVLSIFYAYNGYMIGAGGWFLGYVISVSIFPLILWSIESFLQDRQWYALPILVAWSAVATSGWPELFQLSVFCFIYISIRFWFWQQTPILKAYLHQLLYIGALFLVGMGLAGVFLLPQLHYLFLDSIRGKQNLLHSALQVANLQELTVAWLRLFSNDLLGTAGMNSIVASGRNYFGTPFLYAGLLNLLLVPIYFFSDAHGKRKWGAALLLLVGVMTIMFPQFRSLLWGTKLDYYRSICVYYMFVLILFAAFSLDHLLDTRSRYNPRIFLLIGVMWGTLLIATARLLNAFNETLIIDWQLVKHSVFVLLLYSVLLIFLRMPKYAHLSMFMLLMLTCYETGSATWRTLNYKRKIVEVDYYADDDVENELALLRKHDSTFYRLEKSFELSLVDAMIYGYYGTSSYASFNAPGFMSLLAKLHDVKDVLRVSGLEFSHSLKSLLGVKYFLSSHDGLKITQNKDYIPFGAWFDTMISEENFEQLSQEVQDNTLLQALIIDKQMAESPEFASFERIKPELISSTEMMQNILKKQQTALDIREFKSDQILGSITTDKRQMLFFSIPYDRGWRLWSNKHRIPLYRVDYGLTAAILEPGTHDIRLTFTPSFFAIGSVISLVSVVAFSVIVLYRSSKDSAQLLKSNRRSGIWLRFIMVTLLLLYAGGYFSLWIRNRSFPPVSQQIEMQR